MVLTTASGSPSWIDSFPTGGRLTAILGSAEGASIFARDLPVFGRRKSRGLASWVVLLIAPLALLSAIVGVRLSNGDNNIFTQGAFVVLAGLAAKNAILIVEFAHEEEEKGRDPLAAVLEAARLRLRPIPDDVTCIHCWCRAAGRCDGSRCRDASRHGHRRVRRHDILWVDPDACLLRHRPTACTAAGSRSPG